MLGSLQPKLLTPFIYLDDGEQPACLGLFGASPQDHRSLKQVTPDEARTIGRRGLNVDDSHLWH